MNSTVNVGLVGYGFAGRTFHAPMIDSVPGLKLTKVVERSSSQSKQRYPSVEVVHQASELADDPSIDLVVIATPSATHYTLAKEMLMAGKHVVIDKPFTATTEEADDLIRIARTQNKVLSVFHNRRWDSDFLTIRQLIRGNMLGRVSEFEARWSYFVPNVSTVRWRESDQPASGIFYDLGVHLIDQACSLFGWPEKVMAEVKIEREGGLADDFYDLTLHYEDKRVRLRSSKLIRAEEPRYQIYGTKGSFVKYGLDPQEDALKKGLIPKDDKDWGKEPSSNWGHLNTDFNGLHFDGKIESLRGNYSEYYQNVYQAIAGQQPLVVKPEDARNVIRIVELAKESSRLYQALEFKE